MSSGLSAGAMAADLLARVRAEIEERIDQLRPAVDEYERLLVAADALELEIAAAKSARAAKPARAAGARGGVRGSAAGAIARASSGPRQARASSPAGRARASSSAGTAAQHAIVAALEHGSHTVAELVVVTAMSAAEIREGLRRLQSAGAAARSRRDGRIAYVLSASA